jgi:hypothetical protein
VGARRLDLAVLATVLVGRACRQKLAAHARHLELAVRVPGARRPGARRPRA